jgi:4-O-beta-D-mannosyl-D-glucose phosphorylase
VATTTEERLVDYVLNTPEDALRTAACVEQRMGLVERNLELLSRARGKKARAYKGIRG